ncbi:MAG: hypothetical protein ACPGVK_05905 [Halocynthiibacter sp.]
MTNAKNIAFALCIGSIFAFSSAASATTLRRAGPPAEQPPLSFTGSQYIDSKGCAYIRAGGTGVIKWVPRVTRGRKVICGLEPSLSKGIQTTAVQPIVAQNTVQKTQPKKWSLFGRRPMAATPLLAGTNAHTKPALQTAEDARRTGRVVGVDTASLAARAPNPACQNLDPVARRYMRVSGGVAVRCGPQAIHPEDIVRSRNGAALIAPDGSVPAFITTATGVRANMVHGAYNTGRRFIGTSKRLPTPAIMRPKGYTDVWKDDRLNPLRATGTALGDAQMAQIWTNTVPRRLVGTGSSNPISKLFGGF